MVKIKDIAAKCHTSAATVSKALHDSPELSPETIKKIKKVAEEMGYVPNAYAQALKLKRSYSIGIIFYDRTSGGGLKHEFFSSILDSLKSMAESKGYSITFLSKNAANKMSYLQQAKFRNLDGVIIVSEDFSSPEIVELAMSGLPVVTIDHIYSSCTAIMSDNNSGTEALVDYAFALGHKKFAYIYGDSTDVTNRRLASFHRGLKKHGLRIDKPYMVQGRFHDPKASGRATKQLLELYEKPTCILYPDDVSLLGGMTALSQEGFKIGEDISVIGYDGSEISRIYRPEMTTYVQNSEELGKKAAQALIARIEEPASFIPEVIYVDGHLQKGQTAHKLNKRD